MRVQTTQTPPETSPANHDKVGPFLKRQIAHAIGYASALDLPQCVELLQVPNVHT